MVKSVNVPRRYRGKWLIAFLVLVFLVWAFWKIFFGYASCGDWECFNSHLADCDRVDFIGASDKMIFEYIVRGDSGDVCRVDVTLLQGELNSQDSMALEGYGMTCDLPFGVVIIPESDIGNCHGLLKEGLQDLMIKKLHSYLVQNLGRINLEVLDV